MTVKRQIWLVGVVVILLLPFLTWVTYKLKQKSLARQLEQELQRLHQAGEPTTFDKLIPPVPPLKDGTIFYQLAIAQLEIKQRQLPRPIWGSVYEFTGRKPSKPINPSDVQKALQATQTALRTLRQALNFPHMRMTDWGVENPFAIMFPHFSKFREFARLLVAEGKLRKQKGDIDGAIESHMAILKLARRIGDEPSFVIGFLLQGAIYAIAFNGLQQVLSDANASPQTYQALMAELASWDIDRDFVRALQSERVLVITTCKWMQEKASKRTLRELLSSNQPFKVNLTVFLKPKGFLITQNSLTMLKHLNSIIAVARKGAPYDWEAIKQLEQQWQREIDRPAKSVNLSGIEFVWDENAIAKMLMPVFSNIFYKAASYHAMQRIAQAAIALRLYRQERGYYPEALQELVPKYLPNLPIDPFDGKPLRYKRLQLGFKVWSVGENMKDDGGVEVREAQRWKKGDIVWESSVK